MLYVDTEACLVSLVNSKQLERDLFEGFGSMSSNLHQGVVYIFWSASIIISWWDSDLNFTPWLQRNSWLRGVERTNLFQILHSNTHNPHVSNFWDYQEYIKIFSKLPVGTSCLIFSFLFFSFCYLSQILSLFQQLWYLTIETNCFQ